MFLYDLMDVWKPDIQSQIIDLIQTRFEGKDDQTRGRDGFILARNYSSGFGTTMSSTPNVEKGIDWLLKSMKEGFELFVAAMHGHKGIVRMLLEAGANVKAARNGGITALITAAASGYKEIVSMLLENGSRVDEENDKGATALGWASAQGHNAIVQLLMDRGANINHRTSENGNTPLLGACSKGQKATVGLLLDNGADRTVKNNFGETARLSPAMRILSNCC